MGKVCYTVGREQIRHQQCNGHLIRGAAIRYGKERIEMKITFTDKNVTIPNRIYSYTEQKFNELDRFFRSEPEASAAGF